MRILFLVQLMLLGIVDSAIGADPLVPDRRVLENLARACVAERIEEVSSRDLVLRDFTYTYELNVAEKGTNEYFGLVFADTNTISETKNEEHVIISLKAVSVIFTVDGTLTMNVLSEMSKYRPDGRLISSRGEDSSNACLPIMESLPKYRQQLQAVSKQVARGDIIRRASAGITSRAPSLLPERLQLKQLYYEWSVERLHHSTNEVIWVDFLMPAGIDRDAGEDGLSEAGEDKRVRVALDSHGNVANVTWGIRFSP